MRLVSRDGESSESDAMGASNGERAMGASSTEHAMDAISGEHAMGASSAEHAMGAIGSQRLLPFAFQGHPMEAGGGVKGSLRRANIARP